MDTDKYFTEAENDVYHLTQQRDDWRRRCLDVQMTNASLQERYDQLARERDRLQADLEHLQRQYARLELANGAGIY